MRKGNPDTQKDIGEEVNHRSNAVSLTHCNSLKSGGENNNLVNIRKKKRDEGHTRSVTIPDV